VNIVLVDGDAPWVRAVFGAMPADVTVHAFRPHGPAAAVKNPGALVRGWRQTAPRWWERSILAPSWSKAPRLTTLICAFHLGRRLAALHDDAVAVFTLPYYAGLPEQFPGVRRVYFAYDPYECYTGWDPGVIAAGERSLLKHCDAAFAISPALADDFGKQSDRPVFVQPNGVSETFLAAFDRPLPPPDELPAGGPPIVGCVGQISRAYDLDLLAELVRLCPEMTFAFVGPVFDEGPELAAKFESVFAAPNVRRLGPKPHGDLPRYIQRFDACLNPLRVDCCNNRRSLLRLYDYLASDRPIVSTAVASALDHRPHVEVGGDAGELAALLRRAVSGDSPVDRVARPDYIRRHTWERRAELFLNNLRTVTAARR
jgi:glycosyltransferase involved in cell wall biosynthesis